MKIRLQGIKNFLICAITFVVRSARRVKSLRNSHGKVQVLIVATTGLGDSLMMTPAIRELKLAHPDLGIVLLVTRSSYQIFKDNPFVDGYFFFDKGRGFLGLVRSLLAQKIEYGVILHASDRLAWLACILSTDKTVAASWQQIKVPLLLFHDVYQAPPREHRVVSHLRTISNIFRIPDLSNTKMDVFFSEDLREKLLKDYFCSEYGFAIGIVVGAKDRYKCWPIDKFRKLIVELNTRGQYRFVLLGSAHDFDLMTELVGVAENVEIFEGDLHDVAAFISLLDLVISGDTGLMHLAEAVGAPVISLFAPTDFLETGPLSELSSGLALVKGVTCFPSDEFKISRSQCFNKGCRRPVCMEYIHESTVVGKVLEYQYKGDRCF